MSERIVAFATARIPSRPLAVTRIGVGFASLFEALQLLPLRHATFDPARFHLSYGLPAIPPEASLVPFGLWIAGALGLAIGAFTRGSAWLAALGHGLFFFADRQNFTNHGYLILVLVTLIALADSGAALSLDARRRGSRANVARWPAELLRLQLAIVYVFAALTKLNADWLSGAFLDFMVAPQSLGWRVLHLAPGSLQIAAVLVAVMEGLLGVLFAIARGRRAAIATGVALHLGILAVFPANVDLLLFALSCLSVYPLLEPLARGAEASRVSA
ncbi:MAG: HTTM domain-containing protein [Candidatus Binatia bacterium]